MSLLSTLANAFAPKVRSIGTKTFRQIARETAVYSGDLAGYRPYLGDHEPPVRVATEQRAKIVYDAVLAAEPARVAEISALLEREGLAVDPGAGLWPTIEAWDAIGRWILARIEGSREPGSAEYAPFVNGRVGDPPPKQVNGESTTEIRPLWVSVAFDLSLLLGRHAMSLGGGAWARDGERRGREGSVAAEPRVVFANGRELQPFGFVAGAMRHALALRLGVVGEENMRFGDLLRLAAEDFAPEEPDPEAEFIGDLEEQLGIGPLSEADVAELLAQHGLHQMPKLPPHLAEALAGRG